MATPRALVRILVACDQASERQRLCGLLRKDPEIAIVAQCGSAPEALLGLKEHLPEIAFLDLETPGSNSFDLVATIPAELRPIVVFVASTRDRAADAFDLHAADYLVKPLDPTRVQRALARARALVVAKSGEFGSDEMKEKSAPLQRLIVPTGDKRIVISAEDIDWIESANNYAILHVGRDTHILRETLAELETRLGSGRFFRVSRSAIVNLDRVREILSDAGEPLIVLVGGTRLPVTRGIREVQARLETG